MSSLLLIKTEFSNQDNGRSNDSIAVDSFIANPSPSPTYTQLERMVELLVKTEKILKSNPSEHDEELFLKHLSELATETLKIYKDPSFKRILRSFGWSGSRFQGQQHFPVEKFLQALSNLYLKGQLKEKQEFFVESFMENDGINYLEKIASFLPDIVIECLRNKAGVCMGSELCPASYTLQGACMIIDISNFSKYSASMCSQGMKGLDELRKVTSGLLGLFVKSVYEHDGDVIAFAGDALICVFANKTSFLSEDSKDLSNIDASFRALHCANILRTVQFGDLSTHIGISYGELYLAFLGGHNGQWVYLINGRPVPLLSSCVEDALPHTIVVTPAFHSQIMNPERQSTDERIRLPRIEFELLPSGNFLLSAMEKSQEMINMLNDVGRLESFSKFPRISTSSKKVTFASKNSPPKKILKRVSRSTSIRNISLDDINNMSPLNGPGSLSLSADTSFMFQQNNNPDRLLVDALVLFLPLPITLALHTEGNHMVSELRQVTTLFMALDSYDPAVHSDPITLQPMFLIAQQALTESGGFLRQFLVDDKGCVLIAMWGVPSYTYSNNGSRALFFAAATSKRLAELGHRCSIGITTGTVFCGTIGAIERCDYAGIGTEVNLAARFMAKAKGKVFLDDNTYDNLNLTNRELLTQVTEPLQLKGMPAPIRPFYYSSESMPNLTSIDNTCSTGRNSKRSKLLRKKTMVMLEKELDKVASRGVNNMSPSVFRQSLIRAPRNISRARSIVLSNVHCIILCGPPGSGKNTAAEYFRMSARDRHIQVIDIKLQAVQRTIPYEFIRSLFLELVGSENFKTSEQQNKVLEELIENAYGEESETVKKSAKRSIETILGLHRSSSPESRSNPGSPGDSSRSRPSPQFKSRHPASGDEVMLSSYGGFEETRESLVGHNIARDKSDFSFYKVISSILRSSPTALVVENAHCCDELSWNELLLMMARGDFDLSILLMMKTNALHRLRSTSHSTESPGPLRSLSNANSASHSSINGDKSMSFLSELDTDVLVTVGLDQITFPSFKAIAKHPNTSIIEMKALNEEEVRSLLVHTLNTENVSSNLVSFVFTVSSGNPYWCKTIAQFVQEHGLDQLEDTLQASKHNHYSNQHSLKVLMLLRVEALSAWHQKVLKYASVLGLEFEVNILEAVIPPSSLTNYAKEGGSHQSFKSSRSMLVAALETLEKSGFLMCISESPEALYGFQNDLIQRVIYELIPPSDASAIHLSSAENIEVKHEENLRQFYPLLAHHYMMGLERSKAFKYEIKSAALAVSSGAFNDGLMFANSAMTLADNAIEMDVIAELADHAVQYLQVQHNPIARDRFNTSMYEFVLGDSIYSPRSPIASVVYQDASFQQNMGLYAPSGSLYLSPISEARHSGSTSVYSKQDKILSKRQESLLFTESFLHGNSASDEVISKSFGNLKQRAEGMRRQMLFGQPAMTDQEQQKLLAAKTELMRSNTLLAIPNRTETMRRAMSVRSATSEQPDTTDVPDGLLHCCAIM